ncbi:MAG: prepilin-type N-terminal cleavage/methylation domain-containing protein [Patescibacteria group bacterium]
MLSFLKRVRSPGFTLLEVLLVVAIIAILAGIIIIAINPTKQLGDTRNTQRRADVNTIISAVYQFAIDHQGEPPLAITTVDTEICRSDAVICTGMIDLSALVPNYLVAIPFDPSLPATSTSGSGYFIYKNSTENRIVVTAPYAQNTTIQVKR